MKRRVDNAFTRSSRRLERDEMSARELDAAGRSDAGSLQTGPVARLSFAPLEASLALISAAAVADAAFDGVERWGLQLSPMRLADALSSWCGTGESPITIVLNAQLADGGGRTGAPTLRALCAELDLDIDGAADGGWADCVALADPDLARLVADGRLIGATLVRIEGSVEPGDVGAVRRAIREGRSAWEAEFRVTAVLEAADDRSLALVTAQRALATLLLGENLRQYMAAVLDHDTDTIGWLAPWQLEDLLGVSGNVLVRSVETDVYSTFVDVGVNTSGDDDSPAAVSLIYDIPSASWHGA